MPFLPGSVYRDMPFPSTEDADSLRALATAGLVKSGTGTLEAALSGMPFAIAYVTHPATWFLARRLVRVPYIGLANLVAGRRVAPEFLQDAVASPQLPAALAPLLDRDSAQRRAAVEGLAEVRAALGSPGAARRIVDMMDAILASAGGGGGAGSQAARNTTSNTASNRTPNATSNATTERR